MGAATLRPHGQRSADRRDGAQGRRGAGVGGRKEAAGRSAALQGTRRRQAVPRRLVRRRAKRLCRRRVQPDRSARATAARRGSPGSTEPTTRNSSTSTRSARRPASCSSPAKAACVLKLDGAAQRFRASDGPLQRQLFRRGRRRICGRRLRPARQRLSAATIAARRGPRSTPDCRRRSSAQRAPRTALRCSPMSAAVSRPAPMAAARSARWRSRRRCRSPESPMRAAASLRSSGRAASRSPR